MHDAGLCFWNWFRRKRLAKDGIIGEA
jgi:hypothetical protein